MSNETKFTPGPWSAFNMVDAKTGKPKTPRQLGKYVENCVLANSQNANYLFISCTKPDGDYDVCHVGNGPDGPYNAALIAAAPDLYAALSDCARFLEGYAHYLPCKPELEKAAKALAKARGEA